MISRLLAPAELRGKLLLNVCQGMGRRTRVSIEAMEEGSLYIRGSGALAGMLAEYETFL